MHMRFTDRAKQRTWEFEGELVHREVTRSQPDRWVEIALYELDGDEGWVTVRSGMSNIYHRDGTSCRTASGLMPGLPATVGDLPDDAMPCPACEPPFPQDLEDHERIRYEFPRITVDAARTPQDVVTSLTVYRSRKTGERRVQVSQPVAALLAAAAEKDPRFADLTPAVEHIGTQRAS